VNLSLEMQIVKARNLSNTSARLPVSSYQKNAVNR